MSAFRGSSLRQRRALFVCVAAAVFVALLTTADARTRRKRSAFKVALQPFSLVRQAVHAVADPIVHNAPRAAFRAATAPVRIVRTVTRVARAERPRHEDAVESEDYSEVEDEDDEESAPLMAERHVRVAQPVYNPEPIRVAYVVPQHRTPAPPEPSPRYDDEAGTAPPVYDREEHEAPEIESRGSKPMVAGSRAVLRNGIAYAPSRAPQSVKNAIWAANALRRKPYVWGGGHGSFYDRGYDCSGTVSFMLHHAGALDSPLPSSEFMRYGERGRGRWITVYSRRGHTFAVIAGLRLDTTDFQNGGNSGPRWHADARETRGYVARHPRGM